MPAPGPAAEEDIADLARRLSHRLAAYVAARLGDPEEARDVVQEVFVRALRHRETLESAANPAAWLHSVARAALVDHVRRRRVRSAAVDPALVAAEGGQESADPYDGLAGCIEPLVERLPPPYRQAVTRVDLHGERQTTLAQELGLSVSAVKSRTQRGRRLLKQALVDCCRLELDRQGRPLDGDPPANEVCCPNPATPAPAPGRGRR